MKAMTKVRALSAVIAIAGVACASTGNSSATPSQPERTSQVSSQAPSRPTTIDESAPGTIPAGQEVDVRLRSTLSSETATVEQRFETTTVPTDRHPFLSALGSFRDPALRARGLRYVLTGPIRPHELGWIPMAAQVDPRNQDEVWAWWQANYDSVASRMPPEYTVYIPYAAAGCSEERARQAETFFADPKHSPPGTLKELAKVVEGVRDCVGLRSREGEAVARALTELARGQAGRGPAAPAR